ncbi:MAG: hypothetical protein NVS3B16_25890 [Vulcanimicrobiaceae bacterium]
MHEGDAYQVNYCVPFRFRCDADPWPLFCALERRAHVGHAAFVRHGERALLSLSPELFVRIEGRDVWTKPMKGTAPAGESARLASAKNRAEHVMIVDLLRNDLARVAERVDVEALLVCERYPTFDTMTSTIHARLRANATLRDLFAAMFPCGSITGAPKPSAMRIIDAIEPHPRRVAMGTIGYLEPERRGVWNVAIRTLEIEGGAGVVHIGGGIVAGSTIEDERAEIALKRRLFDGLVGPFHLFETLRVENGACASLEGHLARMLASADVLGFDADESRLRSACANAFASEANGTRLLRVALERDGAVTWQARAYAPLGATVRITTAPVRLRSDDPILRHKTSLRDAYDRAARYAATRDCFDALLLNERGELADGARTTLFLKRDGVLLTPPLAAGALAGVLRAELLAGGAAREAALAPEALASGDVYVGNAARGLLRATVVA